MSSQFSEVLAHHLARAGIGADRAAIRVGIVLVARHADGGEVFHQHGGEPGRVLHDVDGEAHGRVERQQEAVPGVVFAVRRHDRIGGDDQRLEPVVLGALDQLVGQFALLPDIELEPQAEIRLLGDLLHRRHRAGGEREGDFRRRGGFGELELTLMPAEAGGSGGCDRHRQGDFLAEQSGFGAATGDVHQGAVAQLDAFEGGAVVAQGQLVLGGAIDEFEHAARQPAFCRRAQVVHVVAAVERGHRRCSPLGASCPLQDDPFADAFPVAAMMKPGEGLSSKVRRGEAAMPVRRGRVTGQ